MTKATLKALNWELAYNFRDWPTIILMPRSLAAHMELEEYLRALRLPAHSRERHQSSYGVLKPQSPPPNDTPPLRPYLLILLEHYN